MLGHIETVTTNHPEVYFRVHGQEKLWYLIGRSTRDKFTDEVFNRLQEKLVWVEEDIDGKKQFIFIISPENAKWKKANHKSVACCAYNATEDFMAAKGLGKLHSSDRSWYVEHPHTVASGLPMHFTLSILQALVAPYGLGISKVSVRPGTGGSEEMRGWEKALGVNPMAVYPDRDHSNEQYVQLASGGNEEMLSRLREECEAYRFEWSDSIQGPAVVFHGNNGGGHASFKGSRQDSTGWWMALQYDRLENIKYYAEPPVLDYDEGVDIMELDVSDSKAEDGTQIWNLLWGGNTYGPRSNPGGGGGHPWYGKGFQGGSPKVGGESKSDHSFRGYQGDNAKLTDRALTIIDDGRQFPLEYLEDSTVRISEKHYEYFLKFCSAFNQKAPPLGSRECLIRPGWVKTHAERARRVVSENQVRRGFSKLAKLLRKHHLKDSRELLTRVIPNLPGSHSPEIVQAITRVHELSEEFNDFLSIAELWQVAIRVFEATNQTCGFSVSRLFVEMVSFRAKELHGMDFVVPE